MPTKGVCLLQVTARPRVVTGFLNKFGWGISARPPCRPDLAPSDYHTFLRTENRTGCKRFDDDDDEMKEEVD